MTAERYAVYLAPPQAHPLWRFGSLVLGYDAATGEDVLGFAPQGMTPDDWRAATERPRAYGFHGTLKAPFRLSDGHAPDELEDALAALAATVPPFHLPRMVVSAIAEADGVGFAALVPSEPSVQLNALEERVVRELDRFRAPLTDEERRKRRPERLSARQIEALDRWGYPHVGPDFRFHMTLSGPLAEAADVARRLEAARRAAGVPDALAIDALVLFRQRADGRFRIIGRFPLGAAPP